MEERTLEGDNSSNEVDEPQVKLESLPVVDSGGHSPVKSNAIVKYSAVKCPATFARLQCNTDLNNPPSNWLSSSAESYGLQHVPAHSSGFSSFRLAHMFPDCVGQVDVVSDAENIKKLLKIPYSRGAVSMMVHRVENTLLIDDFDIHKHLLHQAKTEWEWLKEFLLTHVLQSMSLKDRELFQGHRRSALQNKLLVSKFLHHSLMAADPPPAPPLLEPTTQLPATAEIPLPEPQVDEELPGSSSKRKFLRNVVWTFEDIQMLIGTDMPIFGGNTHPCISLRLCDMAKPISVLTGIDYWLDNLMSNVPEVVMCFHLDGIVQRYELVKTEDLPYLDGSKFSPKVIRDVAQNILSFLKANAAKAGHTYWLFKGKDDDVVKLYDLTSLCSGSLEERGQNPFTVPVAMLLYRVARNMKHSNDTHHQRQTIRFLLDNCVRLLDAQKYPQIVTSAHYMLSDLYIPATIDPAAPVLDDELSEGERSEESEDEKMKRSRSGSLSKTSRTEEHRSPTRRKSCEGLVGMTRTKNENEGTHLEKDSEKKSIQVSAVKALQFANMTWPASEDSENEEPGIIKPPPLGRNIEERCLCSLKHVAVGLQCLQFFGQQKEKGQGSDNQKEEMEPQMTKPFEPIPMPYAPLNPEKPSTSNPPPTAEKKAKTGKSAKSSLKIADEKKKSPRKPSKNEPDEGNGLKKLLCSVQSDFMPTWQTPDSDDNISWNVHLKTLLYEKACLVYATLAEQAYAAEKYGRALRIISCVLRCTEVLNRLHGTELTSYLLGRAGDCCLMLEQHWDQVEVHRSDLMANSGVDAEIEHEMIRDCPDLDDVEVRLVPSIIESKEQMLLASFHCYKRALALRDNRSDRENLLRRVGNVHNELGVLYMHLANLKYQEIVKPSQEGGKSSSSEGTAKFKDLLAKSLEHLEAGVISFEEIGDSANLALLHSNTGRLLRLCAHYHAPGEEDTIARERNFYNKSLISYQKALDVLGNRKNNPSVWDTVNWELSTALYNLAVLFQDFPGPNIKTQEEAERTAVDLLQRALKHCDLDTPGPQQPMYQLRAATLHHRLASLYHKSYRNLVPELEDRHARGVMQSCRLHYEKAVDLLLQLEHPLDYFNILVERIALAELQAQYTTNQGAKLKVLLSVLDLVLAAEPMLSAVAAKSDTNPKTVGCASSAESEEDKKTLEFLELVEQRLQHTLLCAAKISSAGKKEADKAAAMYKKMYSITLRAPGLLELTSPNAASILAKHLLKVITELKLIERRNNSGRVNK